jgi:hypothetical protein
MRKSYFLFTTQEYDLETQRYQRVSTFFFTPMFNTRRDVAMLRLYKVLDFTHVPPKPKISCKFARVLLLWNLLR